MHIAVIADTHGHLPSSVLPALRTADEIWHLGDFCDLATLSSVIAIGRPFYGVLGNNDYSLDLPEKLTLEREGVTFLLIHIPPRTPGGVDVILHGHTHAPRDEIFHGTRVLNPGTIGKPNKGFPPSWAWLDIAEGRTMTWTIVPV